MLFSTRRWMTAKQWYAILQAGKSKRSTSLQKQREPDCTEVDAMRVFLGNASWGMPEWEKELDLDTFDTLFASNVRAAFFLVAAFAPAMAVRGKGSIINVSSMAGQIGFAGGQPMRRRRVPSRR